MDPILGQIIMFGGTFAPRGWSFCEGQLITIASNTALFSILGTTYGGDGRTTFGLPDLRGRAPMHPGRGPGLSTNYVVGKNGGQETHVLSINEMPSHSHSVAAVSAQSIQLSTDKGIRSTPQAGDVPAAVSFGSGNGATSVNAYGLPTKVVNGQLINGAPGAVTLSNGGSQPYSIMQPYLPINYIIAVEGIFPSRP